jgi:cytochrome P450
VVSRLIGFQEEDPDALLAAAFDSTAVMAACVSREELMAAMVRTSEIFEWIVQQLDRATEQGSEGILGVIATAVDDGTLDHGEGVVIMHTLLSAGGESTTSLIGNAIDLLAVDPVLQDRLRAEPELVVPFVEEALRLEPPFRYHLRHANHNTELAGVPIDAGSTVLLQWAAANRDPAEYERADEVVLDRLAPRHHVGFGRGIHLCVGAPLARLEAQVVIGRILERTERFERDPERAAEREPSLMVRRFRSLPLLVTRP